MGSVRADAAAGRTVGNPAADEPPYLDVISVGGPAPDGMVTLHTPQGSFDVAADWPCLLLED
jgi:hypothetical protein